VSARPGYTVTKRVAVDGGESPNAYVGQITVEIRVHYPPRQIEHVQRVLDAAVDDAIVELEERRAVSPHARSDG